MADEASIEITTPRHCKRQTMRGNILGNNPEEYFKRNVFIPFLDNAITELTDRFGYVTKASVKAIILLPEFLEKLQDDDIEEIMH